MASLPIPPILRDAVFQAVPGNYLLLTADFRIAAVTDAYLAATMTTRDAIVGRGVFEVFPDNPNDPAADGVRMLRASLGRVLATREPDRMSLQKYDIRRPDSSGGGFEERYWSPLNTPVLDARGDVAYIIHWVEDVTEIVRLKQLIAREQLDPQEALAENAEPRAAEPDLRQEAIDANQRLLAANKQLLESERRYRFLTEAAPQLIWTADAAGNFNYCNERYLAATGLRLSELERDGWAEIVHPDDRARVVSIWRDCVRSNADRFQLEYRLRQHDGSYRWMLTSAVPSVDRFGVVQQWFGSTTDVHDRVIANEQMRAVQQFQAVGKLAGGMAHEVNNMMTAVLGFGELVATSLGPTHPQRADVDEMIKAGARAADVSRQLLAFSRQQVLQPTVLDLNVVVAELLPVLRRLVTSDRRIDFRHAARPARVLADRSQLEQVLINLVSNARDATSTNGVIRVEVELSQASVASAESAASASTGPFVRLMVRDDGIGMSPDVAARVLEPFFTTKPVGQGTGLGLSMVHGIVTQSGGTMAIESTPGAGTTMIVQLPRTDLETTSERSGVGSALGRGEHILIVEDEPMVRSLARRSLEAAGYAVHHAPNGAAALEFLGTHRGRIDLVLSDVVMPNVNGWQLAERLAVLRPTLPLLFMTGYSGDNALQGRLTQSGLPFVQKPFSPSDLASAVRTRLDDAAGEESSVPE